MVFQEIQSRVGKEIFDDIDQKDRDSLLRV